MPQLLSGVYADTGDRAYEFEAAYELRYLIRSALIDIAAVHNPIDDLLSKFENRSSYYHYLLDNLLFCCGLINERFIVKKESPKKSIINLNRQNFQFSEAKYPVLSKKEARNIIEHLDSRNLKSISDKQMVGGFNVVFPDSPKDLVMALSQNRELYPYFLNLGEMRVYFHNSQPTADEGKEFEIDLAALKQELEQLKNDVDLFWESWIADKK